MTTIRYILNHLRLLWLVHKALTRDSEAALMLTGGDWSNPALRQEALAMLMSEVTHGCKSSDL